MRLTNQRRGGKIQLVKTTVDEDALGVKHRAHRAVGDVDMLLETSAELLGFRRVSRGRDGGHFRLLSATRKKMRAGPPSPRNSGRGEIGYYKSIVPKESIQTA